MTPLHTLQSTGVYAGLRVSVLSKAQALTEATGIEYQPVATIYLDALERAVGPDLRLPPGEPESQIATLLWPALELKATGAVFRYPLVSRMADRLIAFLEVITEPNEDVLIAVLCFHTIVRTVLMARLQGDGGRHGADLDHALDEAFLHYFERHPDEGLQKPAGNSEG